MTPRSKTLILLLILALFGWAFSVVYAVFFVILAMLAYYYLTPKCLACGARGTTKLTGSEVIKQEKAYGIVTRKETVTKRRTGKQGVTKEETVRKREERVPVIRKTIRLHYTCSHCRKTSFRDVARQEEDFSRSEELPPGQTVIIQKEIVKVPCKFCGTLNEIATAKTCSNCGAALK
ncbi:MAG: hypothetical protein ABSB53_03140 [Nitrososphaerales archaeon]|jgi:hypothetical protein